MASHPLRIPDTRVLAIASHVVHGYVGNKVVSFVLQSLGCEVSGINTVNYSNHTGYKQFSGTKTDADDIWKLYTGLTETGLADIDILLSGYLPSAEAVGVVGKIARDLCKRAKDAAKPLGSFFWALDPVMGDDGRFYVPPSEAAEFQNNLHACDLLLPNTFELATLTGCTATDTTTGVIEAVEVLHNVYKVPHVFVTSTQLRPDGGPVDGPSDESLILFGSTRRSSGQTRLFYIRAPRFPATFTGTGDMFAALLVSRLREEAAFLGLLDEKSWMSPDSVAATELPLARAAERAVASMQAILKKTWDRFEKENSRLQVGEEGKARQLRLMKALELRVVGNVGDLVEPIQMDKFQAQELADINPSIP